MCEMLITINVLLYGSTQGETEFNSWCKTEFLQKIELNKKKTI